MCQKKGCNWESTNFSPRTEFPPEAKKSIRGEFGEMMPHPSLGFEVVLSDQRAFFCSILSDPTSFSPANVLGLALLQSHTCTPNKYVHMDQVALKNPHTHRPSRNPTGKSADSTYPVLVVFAKKCAWG